jgi:hypothetical protein
MELGFAPNPSFAAGGLEDARTGARPPRGKLAPIGCAARRRVVPLVIPPGAVRTRTPLGRGGVRQLADGIEPQLIASGVKHWHLAAARSRMYPALEVQKLVRL